MVAFSVKMADINGLHIDRNTEYDADREQDFSRSSFLLFSEYAPSDFSR